MVTADALREQPENQSVTRELCDLGWSLKLSVLGFLPCNNSACLMGPLVTKPEKMCLCSRDGAGLASRNRTLRSCYLNTGLSLSHPTGRWGQTQLFPPASVLSRLDFHNPDGKGGHALGRPGLGRKAPPRQTPAPISLAKTWSRDCSWKMAGEVGSWLPSPHRGKGDSA